MDVESRKFLALVQMGERPSKINLVSDNRHDSRRLRLLFVFHAIIAHGLPCHLTSLLFPRHSIFVWTKTGVGRRACIILNHIIIVLVLLGQRVVITITIKTGHACSHAYKWVGS